MKVHAITAQKMASGLAFGGWATDVASTGYAYNPGQTGPLNINDIFRRLQTGIRPLVRPDPSPTRRGNGPELSRGELVKTAS